MVRISTGIPVYRMQNFRTFTNQAEHVAKEHAATDFFSSGQEVESVQQVQHGILAHLAERRVSDFDSIQEVLKREKQILPLLITSTGVVVNGNRRLAAMRELHSDPSGSFPEFAFVDCAVLPADTTPAEILDIEAVLQGKHETKLDYDWVGDAQLMNAMVAQHGTPAAVSKLMNRPEKEIRNAIQALAEADLYLKEWVKAPGQYSLVREDAEQLFKDIPKRLEGKDEALQEASRAIAWTLFENKDRLGGRLYSFNAAFGKLAGDVMERLVEELGVATEVGGSSEEGEDFDVDFGEEATVSYAAVIEQLRDPETARDVSEKLIEAAQGAIEGEKGQKSGQASLSAIKQAHAKLMAVDVSRAAADTHATMRKQLEGIEQLARLLMKKLDNYKKPE